MVSKARVSVRFRRSMRAISPVLSVLMMIAIAVAASLVAYAWIMGYIGGTTSKVGKAVMIQSVSTENGNLVIFVQNVGMGSVRLVPDGSVYVNDVQKPVISFDGGPAAAVTVAQGQTVKILVNYLVTEGEDVKTKVVTSEGTFTEMTKLDMSTTLVVYTISASVPGSGGQIAPVGSVPVNSGASQTFTITPDTGYQIVDVVVDTVSQGAIGSYTFTNVQADHAISASFAISTFTITVAPPSGGTINPAGPSVGVNYGADQTFTIAPNTGYHIVGVSVDGAPQGAITSYTFTNVQANHDISASFAIDTFTITVNQGSGGTISPGGIGGIVTVNYGVDQTFTFTPNADNEVVDVIVDGTPLGRMPSYTFSNVQANHVITATFQVIPQVTYQSAGTASGLASGNPTPAYPSGLQANDLILLQVVARGDSPTIATPAGFTLLYGPESSATSGTARVTQAIYYKVAAGTELPSQTVTVTITQSVTHSRFARMYAFRNVALPPLSFVEGGSVNPNTAHSNTYAPQTVTTLGVKRLVVSFEALGTNPLQDNFDDTAPTGGTWSVPSGGWYNGAVGDALSVLAIQTATLTNNPGTISGGTDASNTCDWIVRSFALVPR